MRKRHSKPAAPKVRLSYYERAINRGLPDRLCEAMRTVESLITVVNDIERKNLAYLLDELLVRERVWVDNGVILRGEHEADIEILGMTEEGAALLRAENNLLRAICQRVVLEVAPASRKRKKAKT